MFRHTLLVASIAAAACQPTVEDGAPLGGDTDALAGGDTDADTGVDPGDDTDVDTDTDTDPDTEDPRRDPSRWPDRLGPADRPARLETPSGADGSEDLPVVLLLHGYSADGNLQDRYFELSGRVDDVGFVLVVPDGTRNAAGLRFWNASDACCNFYGSDVDDVSYLLGLLDELESRVPIDPDRITVLGHSNGGFMAYRLACDAADRLAGIASLAGANTIDPAQCQPSEPISALQMHGTVDLTVRYDGGRVAPGAAPHPGAEASIAPWAALADCDDTAEGIRADFDRNVPGDETRRLRYLGCGDVDVQLWSMRGSGHLPTLTPSYDRALLDWLLDQRKAP